VIVNTAMGTDPIIRGNPRACAMRGIILRQHYPLCVRLRLSLSQQAVRRLWIIHMPRCARVILPGVPHHVVARGVDREPIFRSGSDKRRYLARFVRIADEEGVTVHAYCLMHNHVHWLITPQTTNSLAKLFQRLHTGWATFYNRREGRTGHLFQNRYHSTPVDENHYWTALRYIEVNPRRAGVSQLLEDWEHSSAKAHLTGAEDPLIKLAMEAWQFRFGPSQWREFLEQTDSEREANLRRAQAGSRPCGERAWINVLEQTCRRKLGWSPPGRPRKAPAAIPKIASATTIH
jgi:putative transposase